MKYFSIVLLLALVVVLAVSFWPTKESGGVNPSVDGQGVTLDSSPTSQGEEKSPLEVQANENLIQLMGSLNPEYGENCTFVDSSFILREEGTLLYTITDGTVITNFNDLSEGTLFYPYLSISESPGATFKDYMHPYSPEDPEGCVGDYVLEDGSFIPNVYMVQLTVRVENQDASCYTYDENHTHSGFSYDPYLFWIKDLFKIEDIGNETTGYNHYTSVFYSDYDSTPRPDNYGEIENDEITLAFTYGLYEAGLRIEPGEVKEITLGYAISMINGRLPNPEDLCAVALISGQIDGNSYYYNEKDQTYASVSQGLYLGLSWPEGME